MFSVFGKLKLAEKVNAVRYPITSVIGYQSKRRTDKYTMKTQKVTTLEGHDGTTINAYYHATWNAFMTYDIGPIRATQFANAHEQGETGKHTEMDKKNNELGRAIGKIYLSAEDAFKREKEQGQFTSEIAGSRDTYSFSYLNKTFTISNSSNPYDIMSDMVMHAIAQNRHSMP
ncbi:MAG: DUF6973 domain-containing protein [Clostridia bacterium]